MLFGFKKNNNGQGLLEVVVAIGVLSTGVFSLLTLMTSALNTAIENQERVRAGNLAREGIEVVRAIRDSNWLKSNVFDAGLVGVGADYTGAASFEASTGIWSMDFRANDLNDQEAQFYALPDGMLIQWSTAMGAPPETAVPLRRLITLNPICLNTLIGVYTIISSGICPDKKAGIEVRSEVRWSVGARTHNLSFVEQIYDWR